MSECDWCGEKLTPEEIEYPATDAHGKPFDEPICDECFHEHYEFTCVRCQDYEYQEYHGMWLVVFEEVYSYHAPVKLGIYEVLEWPYYSHR